jgi:hypothetical protein
MAAHLLAVPTAAFLAAVLWPTVRALGDRDVDLICGIMLLALMVHLLASGGWTVPGIAIVVWLLGGRLTRVAVAVPGGPPAGSAQVDGAGANWEIGRRWVAGSVGGALIVAIALMSLRPVGSSRSALSWAEYCQRNQRPGDAQVALREAMAADPWAIDPALWMADLCRWQLIVGGDTPERRSQWETSMAEAKRRAGDAPAVDRVLGSQRLHVYQRYGQTGDLEAAEKTFREAAQWNPSDQWLAAQVAVIADARGQSELANEMASAALRLSRASGNIERSLERQQVFVAQQIGIEAGRGPQRRSASELLANQIAGPRVQAAD